MCSVLSLKNGTSVSLWRPMTASLGLGLQARGSLRTPQETNNQLGLRQLRLVTGLGLNRAEDDHRIVRGQAQVELTRFSGQSAA